ncbi:hypothetical protein F5Y11DRAFT_322451 [Daldinia sp. FL1419]|nr:hypothetical protein F5Y11DRAFT_322451 [Daldinia sp. FL1419]
MKLIIAILPFFLWHTASGVPVLSSDSTVTIAQPPLHALVVDSHSNPNAEKVQLATRKARFRGLNNAADNKISAHVLPEIRQRNNVVVLKSNCKQNSTTFVNTTAAGSPPATHCAALVEQVLSTYKNQTCVSFGFAPTNTTAHGKSTTNLLASAGNCAFSVTVDSAAVGHTAIGIGDLVYAVEESITRFARPWGNGTIVAANATAPDKVVGGAGAFECGGNATARGTYVNWALVYIQ